MTLKDQINITVDNDVEGKSILSSIGPVISKYIQKNPDEFKEDIVKYVNFLLSISKKLNLEKKGFEIELSASLLVNTAGDISIASLVKGSAANSVGIGINIRPVR